MNPYIRPRPTPSPNTGDHPNVHPPQHRNGRSHHSPSSPSGEAFPQYQTALKLLQIERNQNVERPLVFLVPIVATTTTTNNNNNNAGFQHYISTGIHELSGAGGSGKTQLACSIVVQAAMSALTTTDDPKDNNDSEDIRAIYVSMTPNGTQKVLQRIRQMISTRLQQEEEDEPTPRSVDGTAPPTRFEAVNRVLRRIQIITCRTIDDWMDALWNENGLITQALTRPKQSLRIIIVDSIADLFRHDDNITSHPANSYAPPTTATKSQSFFVQRSTQLFLMTQRLHQLMQPFLSSQQPLSVLILNQVTMTTTTSHWPEQPALGLTWSNCVHSRFRVQKRHVAYEVEEDDDDHQPAATTIHTTNPPPTHLPPIVAAATATGVAPHKRILRAQRTLTVTHSTRYPMTSTNFIIAAGGCYPSPP